MSPGPDFRGADRERCVSYFTLLWWSKNTLSAMAGRRKRPVRCSRKLRWSFSAVATSREGHRQPRLNLEVLYRRWEWALGRRMGQTLSRWFGTRVALARRSEERRVGKESSMRWMEDN